MKSMINWAQNSGIVKIELRVAEENIRGIQLYKKYGFKEVGRLEKDLRLENGEFLDFILMDKII
jgi:RimJ/RimL family protein N-acetyltransferase